MKDNRNELLKELDDLGIQGLRIEEGVFITDMFVRNELLPDLLALMLINEKLEQS